MIKKYDKWHITGEGKRPNEKILTKYNEDGSIKYTASGFFDEHIYRLYPTNSLFSIKKKIIIHICDVDYGSSK